MNFTETMRAVFRSRSEADQRQRTIVLYIVVVFLYWISQYLYIPTLPTYVQSKSQNLAMVGVILSMYGLWQAIIRIPLGVTADWLGWRKPFIVVGLALSALGAWTMGTASQPEGLLVGRALTGVSAGAWVPLVVVFSGLFPPQEAVRASALLTFVNSVGRVLATGMTGVLNDVGGYSLTFSLAAGVALLATVMMLPTPERRNPPRSPSLTPLGRLLTRRDVLLPSLLNALGQYVNWGTTFGFIPILARQIGASDVTVSLLVSLHVGVFTLGNLATTTVTRRISPILLLYFSFGLLAIGVGGAALVPNLSLLFIAQAGIGLSMGICYPVLMGMSIQRVSDPERTTAMGLHQAIYALGMFAGPAWSGVLADALGIRPMLALTATAGVVLGLAGTHRLDGRRAVRE